MFPSDSATQVSPETIYRSLFVHSRGVLKRVLVQQRRRQHHFRHAGTSAQRRPRRNVLKALALGAKAARSNAGRLYIEYAVSAEGQRMIAQDGEFVLAPGVYPPIQGAEKVTPNMIPMDNPTEQEAKNLSSEFRQIFFAQ